MGGGEVRSRGQNNQGRILRGRKGKKKQSDNDRGGKSRGQKKQNKGEEETNIATMSRGGGGRSRGQNKHGRRMR